MAVDYAFADKEMMIDESLGYPRAYAKICRDRSLSPYNNGPPFTFIPYALQQNENLRANELGEMFPVIDPKARPTAKPKIFINLLWNQLSHLMNAGFDPEVIRVDPYGNVLYYHADSASPLSWDIDHWFPCSRGGLTVASNLRILQWQVCKKKHNKLEFQVPWWDFQLGISVNQFLSIFASRNSDFRHRAFSFLFAAGENEEINSSQTVDSHTFPHNFSKSKDKFGLAPAGENEEINSSQTVDSHTFPHNFSKSKDKFGLAPAAIAVNRKELHDSSLKSLDYNRQMRPQSPIIAARKMRGSILKENENPDFVMNPYQAIVMARDSLKHREETNKMQAEIQKLDAEVSEIRKKNDEEKYAIQDLEAELIKRRRRAEKCRRLAEAQSSYRTMLEKMIRDAMHQSVVYKEQVRLNQAAANALTARLEAQKAICDASEKELHKKFKHRDEIEKQIRPEFEYARKRSRTDNNSFLEGQDSKTVIYLPGIRPRTPTHKELRVFLEEEYKASAAGLSSNEEDPKHAEIEEVLAITARDALKQNQEERDKAIAVLEDEKPIEEKFQRLEIKEESQEVQFSGIKGTEREVREEDEESRRRRGKGNVDRWLQMLLENSQEELDPQNDNVVDAEELTRTDEIIQKLDQKFPLKEKEVVVREKAGYGKKKEEIVDVGVSKTPRRNSNAGEVVSKTPRRNSNVCEVATVVGDGIGNRNERVLKRSESARAFRRIPSSPSLILGGMKKGVECMRKKPVVTSDDEQDYAVGGMKKGVECMRKKPVVTSDDEQDYAVGNNFIKSSIKIIKKAVKI